MVSSACTEWGTMAFAVRWAGQHAGRLSLIVLITALAVTGIAGIDAVSSRMLAAGTARILADAEPDARTVRVVAGQAEDPEAQDAEVRAAVSAAFEPADVVVDRQVALEASATTAAGEELALRMLDDERVPERGALTGGTWPRHPDEIALAEPAAQRHDLRIGDTVTLDRGGIALDRIATVLTVVGTWTAADPTDALWEGDPAVASGESDGAIGPALVAPGTLIGLAGTPTVTWQIAPSRTAPADVPVLQRALASLGGLPDTLDPRREHNTRVIGALGDTLQRQKAALAATSGLLVAPPLIIAILGALVLGIVLATLSDARRADVILLRARGASRRRLALTSAAEAAICAATGSLLALAVLAIPVGVTATAAAAAAGATAFAALTAGVLSIRGTGTGDTVSPEAVRHDAGLRTLPVLFLPALAALVLAVLATWQLFTTGASGTAAAPEPLASAAPALILVAGCALAPVLAAPLAALAERLLRGTRGIAPILPLRQIARRIGAAAIAILCIALAAAAATLALAAPAASEAAEQRTRIAALGGDVRMIAEDGLDVTAGTAATWPGVTDAVEVLHTPVTIGSDIAALVSAPPETLGLSGPMPQDAAGDSIRVVLTDSLADWLSADVGTVLTARIRFVSRPVSFEVTGVVGTLPGVGDGWGVAVSPQALRAAGVELAPDELWLRSGTPTTTAERLRENTTHPVRILTAGQVSAAPVTSVAPTLLSAGAIVAALLGVIGFLAASSAMMRARRGEAPALRALGLRSSRQRMLRAAETAAVAVYAAIAGFAVGAAVAAVILPVVLGTSA